MKKLSKFDESVVNAIYKSDELLVTAFDKRFVEVHHEDGSIYHIKHAFIKKLKVGKFPCIMVYAEHNSPNLFVEYDLEKVIIQPYKGRKSVLKLAKYKFKN